jgi:hypothetical protein
VSFKTKALSETMRVGRWAGLAGWVQNGLAMTFKADSAVNALNDVTMSFKTKAFPDIMQFGRWADLANFEGHYIW